jgi:hypothetical protein
MYHEKLRGCVGELEEKDHTAELKMDKLVQDIGVDSR